MEIENVDIKNEVKKCEIKEKQKLRKLACKSALYDSSKVMKSGLQTESIQKQITSHFF